MVKDAFESKKAVGNLNSDLRGLGYIVDFKVMELAWPVETCLEP